MRTSGSFLSLALSLLAGGSVVVQAGNSGSSAGLRASIASANITTQPVDQSVSLGASAAFSVAATGSGLVYTWFFNGSPLPGQNSSTLPLTDVKPENVGLYFAQLLDPASGISVRTEFAKLTIPSDDLVITSQPATLKVVGGTDAAFFVSATGSVPLSYQWLHDGRAIPGATQTSLTIHSALAVDIGSYVVRVTTPTAGILSEPANLLYTTTTPLTITSPPRSQGVFRGEPAAFEVSAVGPGTLSYVWRHGIAQIPGATGRSLSLANAQPSDAGEYSVAVSSSADGSTAMASAVLTVFWLEMGSIADIALRAGAVSDPVPITLLGDAQTLENATLTLTSSNPAVIAPENVFFGGSGAQRSMIVFSNPTSDGTARITVTASDRGQVASADLNFSVLGANTPPVISNLPGTVAAVLGETRNIPFTITDRETPSASLQVDAQVVGPAGTASAQLSGSDANRVLSVKPLSGSANVVTVVLTVRDAAGATAQQSVTLSLVAPSLQISREGPELVIRFPDTGAGGTIDYRYSLAQNQAWQPFGYVPVSTADGKAVRIPVPVSDIFFRVRY